MTRSNLRHAVRQALWLGSLAASVAIAPAYAADGDEQEVVVTGSRIARPNLDSTVPITTIDSEQIFSTGNNSVGDLLNDLPALRSTFSQSNSSRFLGTAGLNLLDLRGLSTQRTLVLVNGRRHVGSDILNNAVSPDTNTFPIDLIDRVDVVTGGSSAVYGSDAIAGVVNFVLKKDFEGLRLRGQAGQSKYHDADSYFASALAGTNFADGRGNVAFNMEYAEQKAFFASDRPNLAANGNFVVVDTDPSGSDGVADRTFITDIRSATIHNGGLYRTGPNAARPDLAPCGRDGLNVAYPSTASIFNCTFLFNPDGTLNGQQGVRVGIAPNGSYFGGNGTTSREYQTLGIFPDLKRMSYNLIGHFEVTEWFVPFIEAKYVRTDSMRYGSPAFFQGTTMGGDVREQPRFDNPFLTTQARNQITAARASFGLAPLAATGRFALLKNLTDLGGRKEDAVRETTRVVLGANGQLTDNWTYEASVNWGEFKERTKVLGNLNVQRFLLAMDSALDANGRIVCRSQIDVAARISLDPTSALAMANLPGDVSACVPLNPFGEGNITPAMRNYLISDTTSVGSIKQFDVTAGLSGNTEAWFSLPAGPIGIALGAEYRTEENFFKADDLVSSGITFYNALPLFDPPKFQVKEVYGELRIPLLKDIPAIQELTLSTAARTSEYKGNTGTVTAYNIGLEWAPIDDLRFRGGVARAIRAPNLADLYSEQSQNFAAAPNDPCSARNIGAGPPQRAANCAAAGRPATYDYVYTASIEILSGGNPDLEEETSDSLTIGAVYRPSWLSGFSVSVDYFDIEVDNVITAPTAQQIMNACYDSADLNNQFCSLFQRAGAGGGPRGEEQFRILEGSMQQTLLNYAKRTVRGIDMDMSYKHAIGDLGTLSAGLVYTRALERNDYLNPADATRADRILGELGDPENSANLDLAFARGPWVAGWQIRYIDKQVTNFYEDFFSVQGRPPENEDWAALKYFNSVFYHDVRFSYDVVENVNLYVGVDNVANKLPPLQLTGTGAGSSIYEPRGRFFYAGIKAKIF